MGDTLKQTIATEVLVVCGILQVHVTAGIFLNATGKVTVAVPPLKFVEPACTIGRLLFRKLI